jgi:hypothetical protein
MWISYCNSIAPLHLNQPRTQSLDLPVFMLES